MLFSIIVPIFEVEAYLRDCLDSVLSQTLGDFEAILVVDGSPDRCGEIAREYAAKDPRFVVIEKERNEGLVAARKSGLEAAKGDWIVNLDGDDRLDSRLLETLREGIEANEGLDFVLFKHRLLDPDKIVDANYPEIKPGLYGDKELNRFRARSLDSKFFPQYVWCKAVRADFFREIYAEVPAGLRVGEGALASGLCLKRAKKALGLDYFGYYYNRGNFGSLSRTPKTRDFESALVLREKLLEFEVCDRDSVELKFYRTSLRSLRGFALASKSYREFLDRVGSALFIPKDSKTPRRGVPLSLRLRVALVRARAWRILFWSYKSLALLVESRGNGRTSRALESPQGAR